MFSKYVRQKYANVSIEKKRKQNAIRTWQQLYNR